MDIYINILNKSDNVYETIKTLDINIIEKIIIFANDKYYNEESVISDAIFDTLRDYLYFVKPKSKVLKMIGSPVKNNKVKLPYYLGSMDKIKPPSNKLDIYKNTYNPPYIVSDKLDGISALLLYKNNNINLYTRGTATHGMDITKLLKYINVPSYNNIINYLKKNNMGDFIAFRGELILSKKKFDNWKNTMKNARNAVAGLVNSKNINPELATDTKLVLYQIIDPNYKYSKQLKLIKDMGFNCVHSKKVKDITFEKLSSYLIKRRDKSKYEIDGIIVINDDIHPINIEGNPKYSWAFKDVLEDQKAITKIINIEWNITKDNNIIPTIIINPVDIGGVTIKRVTGNNARYIIDNNLGIGATVEVIRSNDVIPKIINTIQPVKVELPNIKYEWDINKVHIKSTEDTEDKDIKNIHYFFSSIKVMGLGEKVIEKLYNGGLNTIKKILMADVNDIISIDGFKQKSAENIINSIKKSMENVPLYLLMKASNKLGRGMGEERAKDVLKNYPNIMTDYKNYSINEFVTMLNKLDGWDDKTSLLFASNFKNFINFYNDISKYIKINDIIYEGKIKNLKIVMSGFRDKNIENKIIENGGEITASVSKNTNILIIKDKSIMDTSKVIKAKELGITIMTIDEFNKFI